MPQNATKDFIVDGEDQEEEEELFYGEKFGKSKKISDRENEYKKRRFQRLLSPEREKIKGIPTSKKESKRKEGTKKP